MKNLVIISILSVGMIFVACTQKSENHKKTSWEIDNLKGKVKSVRSTGYTAITDTLGQIGKGEIIAVEWGFNNTFLKYNEKGKWTEYNSYEPDGSIIRKEVQEYDSEGCSVAQYIYNHGVYAQKKLYVHDDNGNTTEVLRYTSTDTLVYRSVYKYDDKGNNIEAAGYVVTGSADSLVGTTVNKYDEKGNCIEKSNYKAPWDLENKSLYKYDNEGKMIEKNNYDSKENLINKTMYKYNDEGFLTEVCVYNSEDKSDKKTSYKYRYDTVGNWIEKIDYESDIAAKIVERQIEYYQ
ncbi:MAG: hypothetical protein LBS43_01895 [Prevotellaceae bacterium]|jgi:hypothetical protein|nr:hypothetical protein [Prevotellaceae bacterium]